MADIIGHPWVMSDDVATPEEVAQEFASRKQLVDEYYREEEETKRQARNSQAPDPTRRDVVVGDKVFVIGDDNPKNPANTSK